MKVFLMSLAAAALLAGAATAGDFCNKSACCNKCGGQITCKIVCEMKKVEKIVWAVECEPICAANPGCKHGCDACNTVRGSNDCGGCGKCGPCAELLSRPLVKPHCTPPRCRKKLVKKTIVCEVPTYKCVPVSCCPCCGNDSDCDAGESDEPKQEKSAIQYPSLPSMIEFSQAEDSDREHETASVPVTSGGSRRE